MWYEKSVEDIAQEFHTDVTSGLSASEAEKRLTHYGPNKFAEHKPPSLMKLLWEQINSLLIYILIAAAGISAFVGEISDAVIILLVIILNSVIGVIQEAKAEKALEELKKLSTPLAVVMRDGQVKEIPSEQLVPGDIVLIDAGRYIPADLRLIETANLKIEESALTGESVPVDKDADARIEGEVPLGDQRNMAFMSTLSTYGRGRGIVVATAMGTEIGKIAKLLGEQEQESTPLQVKLDSLGRILGIGAVIISALLFLIGYLQGREALDMFLIAVSLAVAAIPEGLPAIVTIVLALGVQRMIKRNAVVRKLPSVETLGAVSVICSDKTGTLTQNKMTVKDVYVDERLVPLEEMDQRSAAAQKLFQTMVLCNDAIHDADEETGDPTEIALLDAARPFGFAKAAVERAHERVGEVPFDSERKMMSTINRDEDSFVVFTKGALESVLPRVNAILQNGEVIPFSPEHERAIIKQANVMSARALRVLAFAYKPTDTILASGEEVERDLTFVGLVGMIDPPREEVKQSIAECKRAGIQTVMITGDHRNTAFAIAKELGIAKDERETMSGHELQVISDEELEQKVEDIRVFARVSPEHKVKIVKSLKNKGHIVSMTGDGVNDAPSLKQADVGVAMGITGTDVAKGAADIVLTDDNFATIVSAVEEGRNIYRNIKKSVLFLLSCNIGEIFALFLGILLGWPAPLSAIHILWVNLITDSLPAISLGVDPDDKEIMQERPRDPKERIFSKANGFFVLGNGLLIGLLTLMAFIVGLQVYTGAASVFSINFGDVTNDALIHAQTMAFITLSVSQLFHALNLRHFRKSIFHVGVFTNKYLIGSILLGVAIQATLVFVPVFNDLFDIHLLSMIDWLFVLGLSLVPIVINELAKWIGRRIAK